MRYLYLHGFASGPQSGKAGFFRAKMAELGLSLEIPDLSEGDFEHLTISGQLAVVERELKGEAAFLFGSSMGGYLAALYATSHPEVHKLVLLAPAFQFAYRWPEKLGPEVTAEWQRTGFREVFHHTLGRMEKVWWELVADGIRHPAEPAFPQPALIFHGVHDDVVPVSFSEEYAAKHSNTSLHILPSDHQLNDQLEQIWEVTRMFLPNQR